MSTEVAAFLFLLNPVLFILITCGGSHCVVIDIILYELFLWSVDAVQCSQKCWMFLADKPTFFMKREIFIPTMCTHQHMLAWNLCCKFRCFIFYHIKCNWHLSFSFRAYRVNSMFCFLKVTVLGSTETLAGVHVYLLVLLLLTSLDICFWKSELTCYIAKYSSSQCGCSVLVSSWRTIVPGPIWIFFFNSTMKELTITDEDAVLSFSFSCDFSVLHALVWLGRAQFSTFFVSWRQSNVVKWQI
jgi:hypothetical protein